MTLEELKAANKQCEDVMADLYRLKNKVFARHEIEVTRYLLELGHRVWWYKPDYENKILTDAPKDVIKQFESFRRVQVDEYDKFINQNIIYPNVLLADTKQITLEILDSLSPS